MEDFGPGGGRYTGEWNDETLVFFEAIQASVDELRAALYEALKEFDHLSREEKSQLIGRIVGAIVFEIGLTVATGAAAHAAKTGKVAGLLKRFDGIPPAVSTRIANAITKLQDDVQRLMRRPIGRTELPFPENPVGRGQAFAYGRGRRLSRANELMREAAAASKVRLERYVDEIIYDPNATSPYFLVDEKGRRIITLDPMTFGKTRAGQLIVGTHELEHAMQFDEILRLYSGDVEKARRAFFVSMLTHRYMIREILTETAALDRVIEFLGGLSQQQLGHSSRYIAYWLQRLGIQ